ncbi:MAG TPA: hypothetical protein VK509_02615 [Polyangiales bacterium]|nr:hypothetical protein [Polyangiales bacterium]
MAAKRNLSGHGLMRAAVVPALGLWLALLSCASAGVASAEAQAPAGEAAASAAPAQPSYDQVIERALNEYRLGNWDEAGALFVQAHALKPSARTLRGMGLSEFENRKYVLALVHCSAALADQRNPLNEEQRGELQSVITRASGFVARVTLALAPEGAQLTVDGIAPVRDAAGNVLLDPGPHELVASDGRLSERRRLEALSGQQIALAITLRAEPNAGQIAGAAHAKDDKGVPPARILTYAGFAVLGVGLAVGTTTGVIVLDKAGDLEDACDGNVCRPEQRDDLEQSQDLALVSNIAFVVAGAGAVAAAAGLIWEYTGGGDGESESVRVSVSPFGAGLRGRF